MTHNELLVEGEPAGRIDTRAHEDRRRTLAADIVERCPFDLRGNRPSGTLAQPRRSLIFRQALKRRPCRLRIPFPDDPYHFEKQWERTRRASMLQCTLIRE